MRPNNKKANRNSCIKNAHKSENLNSGKIYFIGFLILGVFMLNAGILLAQKSETTANKADSNLKSSARVNPVTLAMEFSLPLGSYPGRGGNSTPVSISYSSKLWEMNWINFRFTEGGTGSYNDPYYSKYTTDIGINYGAKSVAGWTSSLRPPVIIEDNETYNQFGSTYQYSFPARPTNYPDSECSSHGNCTSHSGYVYNPACGGYAFFSGTVCGTGASQCIDQLEVTCLPNGNPTSPTNPTSTPPPPIVVLPTPVPQIQHMVRRVRIEMPDGSSHEFRKDDKVYDCTAANANCNVPVYGTFLSVDGSGMRLERGEIQPGMNNEARDVLYLPNGDRFIFAASGAAGSLGQLYLPAEKIIDADGNTSVFDKTTHQWTDTMERPIVDDFPNLLLLQNPSLGPSSLYVKGINNQNLEYNVNWQKLDTVFDNSLSPLPQLKYAGDNDCSGIDGIEKSPALFTGERNEQTYSSNAYLVKEITHQRACATYPGIAPDKFNPIVLGEFRLPDGQKYQFKYNEYGEITKIIYPTGGYERFIYKTVDAMGSNADRVYAQGNRGVHKRFVSFDGVNDAQEWTYEQFYESGKYGVRITAPDTSRTEKLLHSSAQSYFGFENPLSGMPSEERVYDKTGQLRSRTLTEWTVTTPQGTGADPRAERDPRQVSQISIIFENNQALATMSETEYETPGENGSAAPTDPAYFARLNAKQNKSYHYLPLNLGDATNGALTTIKNAFHASGQLSAISQTDYQYSALYKARGFPGLPTETRVLNPANPTDVLAKNQPKYDEPAYPTLEPTATTVGWTDPVTLRECFNNLPSNCKRGKTTTMRTWVKETDTWLETHAQYDNFGNLRKAWDISNDPTRFVETFYEHSVAKPYYYAYPTKVVTPATNIGSSDFGSTESSTVETTYDPTTGMPLSVKNDAGQITKTAYDALSRPWRVYADNYTAPETQTIYSAPDPITGQFDSDHRFVKVRKQIDANNWDEATTWTDGMGRTVKTQAKDSGGDIFTETQYDKMGRAVMTTNPYRAGDTKLWNLTEFDQAGRAYRSRAPVAAQNPLQPTGDILGTTAFDISTAPGFVGTTVTTTDAASRKSRSFSNALGQLLRVDEPGSDNSLAAVPQISPTPIPPASPTPTPNPTPTPGASPNPTPNPTPTPGGGGSPCANNLNPMPGIPCANGLAGNEYPMYSTVYKYNAYGKMVEVTQGGQKRFFLYDSLGRLIRVRQPEQQTNGTFDLADPVTGNSDWTAKFTHDIFGNVLTATDSRGVKITSTYDRAGRVLTKTYSGEPAGQQTPTVYFTYDGKYYGPTGFPFTATGRAKGSLTQVRNGNSTSQTTVYDDLGRAKVYQQITDAHTYTSEYTYDNLSGALIEEKYPDGRIVKNEFNQNGDLSRVFGKASSTATEKTYVNSFAYTAAGGISQMRLGNGRWETAKFNERLQMTELGLGNSATDASLWKINYEYGELNLSGTSVDQSKNTGSIARQTISFNGLTAPFVQTFRYDSLYRLIDSRETTGNAATANWTQQFAYDRFGNRTAFVQNIGSLQHTDTPAIDLATNRFIESNDLGYDKNGNITKDIYGPQKRAFIFNGENKQTEIRDTNSAVNSNNPDANLIGRYFYDGEGKRVKKMTADEITIFVYSGGKLIQEYSTKLPVEAATNYTTSDHLGSPRIITDGVGEIKARRDFMPFGEELTAGIGGRTSDTGQKYSATKDEIRQKFTGYQKDAETQLDFAEARMYNNQHGRFTAVDPLLASGKSANPQTFNRYIYVGNNPVVITDPTGLFGDYYTRSGTYIGSDGKNDKKVWFATIGRKEGDVTYAMDPVRTTRAAVRRAQSFFAPSSESSGISLGPFFREFRQATFDTGTGAAKGTANTGIGLINGAIMGLATVAAPGATHFFDVPQIERYGYTSATEARYGIGFELGWNLAPTVAAAPFAASSALSVVPESETFFRAMSPAQANFLRNTGRVGASSQETMVSPSLEYVTSGLEGGRGYTGEIFQLDVKIGTTNQLRSIGVTNVPDSGLPMVSGGWKPNNAFFKLEGQGQVMNIGLGNGKALNMFNDNLLNVTQIR